MSSPIAGTSPYMENENDCCVTCCCATFCCLCCCYNIKKSTRIKIVWTWLVLLGIASSVVLSCYLYKPDYPYASPSDRKPVKTNVNFLFCEAVTIESSGVPFEAFNINGPLSVDKNFRENDHFSTAIFSDVYSYNFFSLYLLKGSSVKIKHCVEEVVLFYVFSGLENFQTWQRDHDCEFCYDVKMYLINNYKCYDSQYEEFDLNVTKEGEMFFVYENKDYIGSWVNIKLNINRTIYDLNNANLVCSDVLQCTVPLEGPDTTALYNVNADFDIGEADHPKFTTKCVPRVWAYFLIHGFAVLFIGVTSSILIQKLCKDRTDSFEGYTYSGYGGNERTPLLYDPAALPPSYSSVTLSPPKYEDIMRDSEDPPSYLVAVAALAEGQASNSLNSNASNSFYIPNDDTDNNTEIQDNLQVSTGSQEHSSSLNVVNIDINEASESHRDSAVSRDQNT